MQEQDQSKKNRNDSIKYPSQQIVSAKSWEKYLYSSKLDFKDEQARIKEQTVWLKREMARWIGNLLGAISDVAFENYHHKKLTEKETKIFFSNQVILCTIKFMNFVESQHRQLWEKKKNQIIKEYDDFSKMSLQYLLTKFPQKESGYVQPQLETKIQEHSKTEDPEFQMLKNLGIIFNKQNPIKQVKQMVNTLITKSKKYLPSFRKTMKKIFTVDGKQVWNAINSKFRQDAQLYTDQQINQKGMKIKGSQILRIMIKWIEQLQNKFKKVDDSVINRYFPFLDQKNNEKKLNFKERDFLKGKLEEQFKAVQQVNKQNNRKIIEVLFDIFEFIKKKKENFKYINENEVQVGLFTFLLSQSVSNIVTEYLQVILKHLCMADPVLNLVTFNVYDLLRCKCAGTKKQILQIYQKLQNSTKQKTKKNQNDKNQDDIPPLHIVRVKNRLNTSNHDFMVNFKFEEITCQVQLQVIQEKQKDDKKQKQKQQDYNHFNHFIYELNRARFSALTQTAIINSHLNNSINYFKKNIQSKSKSSDTKLLKNLIKVTFNPITNKIQIKNYQAQPNNTAVLCNFCFQFKKAYQSFLDIYKKIPPQSIEKGKARDDGQNMIQRINGEQNNIQKICGECYISCLGSQDVTKFLLGPIAEFFEKVDTKYLEQINKEQYEDKQFYILIIKKMYEKKMNMYYRPAKLKLFCNVFYGTQISKEFGFYSLEKIKNSAYFVFKIKDELKISREKKEIFDKLKNVKIIYNEIELKSLKKQLVYIQNASNILILNIQNSDLIQKEKFKKQKVKTLQGKLWWRMQQHDIQDNFFEVDKIKKLVVGINKLELSNNNLKQINFFSKNQLEHLNVSGNQINSIDFRQIQTKRLKYLNISQNLLEDIHLHGSTDFTNLETLLASKNKISTFTIQTKLPKLERLELDNNRLFKIDPKDEQLPSLKILRLQENELSDTDFLKNKELPKLKFLSLENNKLGMAKNTNKQKGEISSPFDGLLTATISQLQEISLGSIDGIDLSRWSKIKINPQSLKKFHIKNGGDIKGIKMLGKFFNLQQLYIEQNNMTSLQFGDMNMKYLQTIVIRKNTNLIKIERINKLFGKIKKLDLKQNKLQEFNFKDISLGELRYLNLQRNLISRNTSEKIMGEQIPELSLSNAKFDSLIELHLQSNQIQKIVFTNKCDLRNLRYLHLENNLISEIVGLSGEGEKVNLDNLQQLMLNENKLKRFDFKGMNLRSLQKLHLQKNEIETITGMNYINNLHSLQELYLNNNKLEKIDFTKAGFLSIKKIILYENKLTEIKGLKDSPFNNMQLLYLSFNNLTHEILSNITSPTLQIVQISSNNIKQISRPINLPKLKILNLSNYEIKQNDKDIKQKSKYDRTLNKKMEMEKIEKKQRKENQIVKLNFGNFETESLQLLYLENNRIQEVIFNSIELRKNYTTQLPNLKELNLKNNCITKLDFKNVEFQNLVKLKLGSNRLEQFENIIESKLPKLQILELQNNCLKSINLKSKQEKNPSCLQNLKELNLRNNNLDLLDLRNVILKKLQVFNLDDNKLQSINFSQSNFENLIELSIAKNRLMSIEGFSNDGLKKLKILNLQSNQLKKINFNGLKFEELSELNLKNNKNIQEIVLQNCIFLKLERFFLQNTEKRQNPQNKKFILDRTVFKKLETIDLEGNQLSEITSLNTAEFIELKTLILTKNNFKNLKCFAGVQKIKKLEVLKLTSNGLINFEDLKNSKLSNLKHLILNNNLIETIDFTGFILNSLEFLDLNGNKIGNIQSLKKAKFPSLQVLSLNNNSIKRMDFKELEMLRLKTISLAVNKMEEIINLNEAKLPNLESLDIHENSIKVLDFTSINMIHLSKLLLNGNEKTLIEVRGYDELITKCKKLKSYSNEPRNDDSVRQFLQSKAVK